MSCKTNATLSAGASVSRITSQREADRIPQERLLLRIDYVLEFRARTRRLLADRLFTSCLASPQGVEANATNHRRQPASKVVHRAGVTSAEAQPCLLH
jgi:hypothetical protein